MLKNKKILFAFIFLLLSIILVASFFYFKNKKKAFSIVNNSLTVERLADTSKENSDTNYDLVLLPANNVPKNKISQELYARYTDGRMEKIFSNDELRKLTPYGDYLVVLNPGISYGNFSYLQSNNSQQLYIFDKIKKTFLDNGGVEKYTFGRNLEPLIFSSDYKKVVIKDYHYFTVADLERGLIINLFSVPQNYELTPVDSMPDYTSNPIWISDTKFQIVISPKNNFKERKIIIIDTLEQPQNDQSLYLDYKAKSLFSKNKDGVQLLKKYIGDKKGVNFVGDEIEQNKIGPFHYFSGDNNFFGYNSSEDEFYFISTSTLAEDVSIAGSVISDHQSVALFIKYHDSKEEVVVLSADLQRVVFQKYLETNFTFILSEDFYYTIGDENKWLNKNVIRVALYDKEIPQAPAPRDCAGCDDNQAAGFAESAISEQEVFEKAVKDRKPVKFIDIKIK